MVKQFFIFCLLAVTALLALNCGGGGSSSTTVSVNDEEVNYEIRGKVTDLVDLEQKAVTISSSGNVLGTSDESGTFTINLSEGDHTLSFSKSGYTTAYAQVYVGTELPDSSEATLLVPSGEDNPDGLETVTGSLSIVLKPTQNLSLSDSSSVTLSKTGSSKSTQKIFNFESEKVFTRIKTKAGTPVRRGKYEGASLDFSKLDPTRELDAMPGPLSAQDPTYQQSKARFKGRQSSSEESVGLESVTMMDLTLRDADGNAIQFDDGDSLESFIKLPERDQDNYREAYENGERVIPWYSFDPDQNTWVREGEAELVNINDEMYAQADVTHFSWWNLDKPRDRGRLQGKVYDSDGNAMPGVQVILDAIGNSFRTSTITDSDGNYSFRILRNSKAKVFARKDGIDSAAITLDFDDSPETSPHVQDITFQTVNVTGRVISDEGQILSDALVKFPSGDGIYTNAQGEFSFQSGLGGALKLVTQYTENELNFITQTELTSDNLQSDLNFDIVVNLNNIIHVTGQVRLDGVGVANASLYTLNGERTTADSDGVYSFNVSKTAGVTSEDFEITLKAFYFDESTSSFPELSYTIPINDGASELVQNFDFSQSAKVELIGRVLVDGVATQGVEIYCDNGCLTSTDSDGLYSIEGYSDQSIQIFAITTDLSNQPIRLEQEITLFETESGTNQADNFEFVLPQAIVSGNVSIDMGQGELLGLGAVRIISENGVQKQSASNGSYRFVLAPEVTNTLWFEVDTPSGLVSIEQAIEALDIDEVKTLNVSFDRADILNLSPQLESVEISSFKVETNDNVQITVTATDPDAGESDVLAFTASSQDESLATVSAQGEVLVSDDSNTQIFSFNAGSQTGWVETQLTISDGENTITRSVYIEIVETIVNNPPSLLALQAPTKVQSNGSYDISYLVHDPEGDQLSYEFSITPATGFSLQSVEKSVQDISGIETTETAQNMRRLILDNASVGTIYTLSANVSDGNQSLVTTQNFEVVDEAPIFKSFSPDLEFIPYSENPITFSVLAEDPESQALSYSWSLKVDEGSFQTVSSNANFAFKASDYLASSDNVQNVAFLVSVSDGTNTTEKQQNFYVLPADRGITKEPVNLSVVWKDLSQIDIQDSISFSATLTYNTGEQEDVTASVVLSGFSDSALSLDFDTLTALDDGNYLINFQFTSNGFQFEDSLSLTVNPPFLTSLLATINEATLVVGDTIQVFLTALFDNGEQEDVTENDNSQYFSSEEGIASFSDETAGELSAHNVGSTTLSFSYTNPLDSTVAQTSRDIEVQPVQLESFVVSPNHLDLVLGESTTLVGNAIYNNGQSQMVENFFSTSDNPDIAIVNEDHIVFPVGAGNTQFVHTYKENGIEKQSTTTISVTLPSPEIVRLKVVPEDAELNLGKYLDFQVYAIYNTGEVEEIDNASVSMSANLGTYDQGRFTATELGSSTLTFTLDGLEATSELSLVTEPDEATLTRIAKIGGAAYKVEGLRRDIGGEDVDLIVYSDYQTLSSVLVNDPDQPVILDEVSLDFGFVEDFQLTENYLHLATGYRGYSMVTYDNPSSLEIPKGYEYKLDGWSRKVFTQKVNNSRFAYLLSEKGWSWNGRSGIDGLIILDITNPRNITQVGKVKLDGWPTDMAYANGKLYVSTQRSWQFNFTNWTWSFTGFRGVYELDVSNPNLASIINTYSSNSDIYSLSIEDNTILLGEGSTLRVYSLDSILANPSKSISLGGYIREISQDDKGYLISLGYGGLARVTNTDGQFQLSYLESPPKPDWQPTFNALDPEEEDEQPSSVTRAEVYSATQINDVLYLANGFNGLGIIAEESNGLGEAKAGLPNLGYTSELQVSDNILFAASWEKGLIALNVENPLMPSKIGEFQQAGYYISKIQYDEDSETLFAHLYSLYSYWWWCYYGGSLGVNPHQVVALKWENNEFNVVDTQVTEGWVNAMDFNQGKLYMSANDFNVYGWNAQAEIQTLEWDGSNFGTYKRKDFSDSNSFTYIRALKASDNLLAVGSYYGTYFYNLDLNLVSSLTAQNSFRYRYPRDYHFIYNGDILVYSYGRIHYIDLSDPSSPTYKSDVQVGWGAAFDGLGDMAMMGTYWGEIKIVSFKDPDNPEIIPTSEFTSPNYLEFLEWKEDYIYLGSGWNGVYILDLEIPEKYTNFNPIAVLPERIFTTANTIVSLDASGSYDIENDTLSYLWINASDNVETGNAMLSNIDQVQTELSFVDSPIEIKLIVSDFYGSDTAYTTVAINSPPVPYAGPDQRYVAGSNIKLEGSYEDVDNNVTSVYWTQIAGGPLVISDNLSLNPEFTDTQESYLYIFQLTVSDGFESSTDEVYITRNYPPKFTIDGITETSFGDNLTFSVNNTVDIDGDQLSFEWSIDSDIQVEYSSSSNVLNLITPSAATNITILVDIFDGYETYTASHLLSVTGDNFPPVIGALEDILTQRNQEVLITAIATDVNNDPLTYLWEETSGANSITFSDETKASTNLITQDESLSTSIRLHVSDGNVIVTKDFDLIVNDPPQLFISTRNTTVFHTDTINLVAEYYDPENSNVYVSWLQTGGSNLGWIDRGTTADFTPPEENTTLDFTVWALDEYYTVIDTLSVNVIYNFAPEIVFVSGNNSINTSSNTSIFVHASDVDQDAINYQWTQISGPSLSLGNTSSNLLNFIPTEGGTYQFMINISDSYFSSNQIVELFYNATAPVIIADNVSGLAGSEVTLDASLSYDPEGEEISFAWLQLSGNSVELLDTDTANPFFASLEEEQSYSFLVTASDSSFSSNTIVTVTTISKIVDLLYLENDMSPYNSSFIATATLNGNLSEITIVNDQIVANTISTTTGEINNDSIVLTLASSGNEFLESINYSPVNTLFPIESTLSITQLDEQPDYFIAEHSTSYLCNGLSTGNIQVVAQIGSADDDFSMFSGNLYTSNGNALYCYDFDQGTYTNIQNFSSDTERLLLSTRDFLDIISVPSTNYPIWYRTLSDNNIISSANFIGWSLNPNLIDSCVFDGNLWIFNIDDNYILNGNIMEGGTIVENFQNEIISPYSTINPLDYSNVAGKLEVFNNDNILLTRFAVRDQSNAYLVTHQNIDLIFDSESNLLNTYGHPFTTASDNIGSNFPYFLFTDNYFSKPFRTDQGISYISSILSNTLIEDPIELGSVESIASYLITYDNSGNKVDFSATASTQPLPSINDIELTLTHDENDPYYTTTISMTPSEIPTIVDNPFYVGSQGLIFVEPYPEGELDQLGIITTQNGNIVEISFNTFPGIYEYKITAVSESLTAEAILTIDIDSNF